VRAAPLARVSTTRKRDTALAILVPKILGLLWDRGSCAAGSPRAVVHVALVGELDGIVAHWTGMTALGETQFYAISVYAFPRGAPSATKVLSFQLSTDHGPGSAFPYLEHRCSVMTWKRGTWEDALVVDPAVPRTIQQLATGGLVRPASAIA
jgi:hypothetical protein